MHTRNSAHPLQTKLFFRNVELKNKRKYGLLTHTPWHKISCLALQALKLCIVWHVRVSPGAVVPRART